MPQEKPAARRASQSGSATSLVDESGLLRMRRPPDQRVKLIARIDAIEKAVNDMKTPLSFGY